MRRSEKRHLDPTLKTIDTFHWSILMEVESAVVVHRQQQDMAKDHGFHFLFFEVDKIANDVVHVSCTDDVNTSLALKELGDTADCDDDEAVEVHSNHYDATVVGAEKDGN